MAASAASAEAEKIARYAVYYPNENAAPASYIKLRLEIVGLAENGQAPDSLDDGLLTGYDSGITSFFAGKWWNYWKSSLPAMIRELLPVGLDGSGGWSSLWMDSRLCEAKTASMKEA